MICCGCCTISNQKESDLFGNIISLWSLTLQPDRIILGRYGHVWILLKSPRVTVALSLLPFNNHAEIAAVSSNFFHLFLSVITLHSIALTLQIQIFLNELRALAVDA